MPFLYSTLTNSQIYPIWVKSSDGVNNIEREIRIEGGSGVMNRNFITPMGVATEISDEDYAALQQMETFNNHVKNGYLKVDKKKIDPEKAIADMTARDESAPITPADILAGRTGQDVPLPTVGAESSVNK
jgi:hypothetical protein